MFAGKL